MTMSDDVGLAIFPNLSFPEEHWRYFQPGSDDDHLVIFEAEDKQR